MANSCVQFLNTTMSGSGEARPAPRLPRFMFLLALLFAGLGLSWPAQAQTATVSWDSGFVMAWGGPGGFLSNGGSVDIGTTVTFDFNFPSGWTYSSTPTGCNIAHESGDEWRGTITETCHVSGYETPIHLFPGGLTELVEGEFSFFTIFASGGDSPFDLTLESGVVPTGMSFNAGSVTGVPSEEGSFDFTVRATNEHGHSETRGFTLTVVGASAPAPTITSVSPGNGAAEGNTTVSIFGTGFTGATGVNFGGDPVFSFGVVNDTEITVITAPHAQGPVDVEVVTPGDSATAPGAYTYDAPVELFLSINDVSMTEGDSGFKIATFEVSLDQPLPQFRSVTFDIATADGTAIAGEDYVSGSDTGVSMGVLNRTRTFAVRVLGDTTSEPDETFFVNVTNVIGATVVDGQGVGTIQNDDAVTPTIMSLSPDAGPPGTMVTISGTGLTGASSVLFDGVVSASVTPVDDSTVLAEVPAHPGGVVDVTVYADAGMATAPGAFTIGAARPTANPVSATVTSATRDNAIALNITGAPANSVAVGSGPTHGTATVSGMTITYTPNSSYAGADSLTYTASNAAGASAPATVTIDVVDLPPPDLTFATTFETPLNFNIARDGRVGYFLWLAPVHGTVVLTADGGVSYTPGAGFAGTDEFEYDLGPNGNTGKVTITVDPPTITLSPATLPPGMRGEAYSESLSASGGTAPHTFVHVSGTMAPGLTLAADGTLSGTPIEAGTFTFNVVATDSSSESGPFSSPPTAVSVTIGQTFAASNFTIEAPYGATRIDYSFAGYVSGDPGWISVGPIVLPNAGAYVQGSAIDNFFILFGSPGFVEGGTFEYRVCQGPPCNTSAVSAFVTFVPIGGPSNDASLSSLVPSAGALDPAFNPATLAYDVAVDNATTSITLTPTAADANATITVAGQAVASGGASQAIALAVGTTAIPVVVTAEDGTTAQTYTVTVTRTASADATLSNLVPSAGSLDPAFNPATASYEVAVDNATDSITLTPTAADAGATIRVNAQVVGSGSPSAAIPLTVGGNTITVQVTAEDSTSRIYTVNVTRAAPTITIDPATLANGVAGTAYGPVSLTAAGGTAPHVFSITSGALPVGLSLSPAGVFSGTPTQAGSFSFMVMATDDTGFTGTHAYTLTIDAPGININPAIVANGMAGTAYGPVSLTATGGTAPYAFSITDGALPAGLSLSAAGEFSGTPTEAGGFNFTIMATDDIGFTGTRAYTLTIDAPGINIDPATVANGVAGTAYGPVSLTATGGTAPYAFSITDGALPAGLSLSAAGELAGTPTEAGGFSFTVMATDDHGFTGTRAYTLTINAPGINIDPATVANGVAGTAYDPVALTAVGGAAPYLFSITAGALPMGLSLSAAGELAGTPTEAGSFTFTVTATDDNGFTGIRAYTLTIDAPGINIDPATVANGVAGTAYGPVALTAAGGTAPYVFSITSGALPANLSLSPVGELAGTPTVAGSFTFTVTATDDNGFTGIRDYTLAVDAPTITIDPAALANGVAGTVYDPVSLTAAGGTAPYVFSITSGALPANLSLSPAGDLSGTPTEAGNFTVTVTVTDDNGFTGTRAYTLTIDAPTLTIDPATLAGGVAGTAYGPVSLTAAGGTAPYAFAITDGALPANLSLDASGVLFGTPTVAGSFSFTATVTDDNGFTGTRAYTLTLDAPVISLSVPPIPRGKVNTPFAAIRLSASGGTAPYEFAVTGGVLPQGMTLAADGALSGTPTQAGDFPVTVAATDKLGFAGTAGLSINIRNLDLPIAQNLMLEVMAGTYGSIDLTQGATNGPFTQAAISTYPAAEAGTVSIRRDGAAYMLDFEASGTFVGSEQMRYTLSNADGRSAPATVTLNVVARPDPSQDFEVVGLLTAQAEASKRFAGTQMRNFNQRLEQLHDEGERRHNSMNASISMQRQDSARASYAREDERERARKAFARVDAHEKESDRTTSAIADDHNPLGNFAVWSGGFVNFAEADNGGIDLDSTLVGVSGGVDYRFTPKFVGGIGFGFGRDKTAVGGNGTESRGQAWSMAAYGSYKPTPGIFVDGLLGYSYLNFDSRRYVTATGDFALGSRNGHQLFSSLSVGYEHRGDRWLVSPYGRLEASQSRLAAFTESGGGMWDLTYGHQSVYAVSGILGLRVEYAIPMGWGMLKPRARLEYTHDFEGSSRINVGYADIGRLPYVVETELFSKNHLTIGLGVDAQIGDRWTLGFDYRTASGLDKRQQDHSFALKIGTQW